MYVCVYVRCMCEWHVHVFMSFVSIWHVHVFMSFVSICIICICGPYMPILPVFHFPYP